MWFSQDFSNIIKSIQKWEIDALFIITLKTLKSKKQSYLLKRMKKIHPNDKLSKEHVEKAKHNLRAADYNVQGHFDDWAVSQSYYLTLTHQS